MSERYSIVIRRPACVDSYLAVGPGLPLARLTPAVVRDPGAPKPRLFACPKEAEKVQALLHEEMGEHGYSVVIVEPAARDATEFQ